MTLVLEATIHNHRCGSDLLYNYLTLWAVGINSLNLIRVPDLYSHPSWSLPSQHRHSSFLPSHLDTLRRCWLVEPS